MRLIRSSNSPRYLVPANNKPISKATISFSSRISGTSLWIIRCAKPSATAVLPTPGSPINTGLFFLRLTKIWITLSISFARPTTGSSFPSFACSVRFVVYSSREYSRSSSSPPITNATAFKSEESAPIAIKTSARNFSTSIFKSSNKRHATPSSSSKRAKSICSVPI